MKCINKRKRAGAAGIMLAASFLLNGCGEKAALENAYNVYDTTSAYGMDVSAQEHEVSYFADDLCVSGTDNLLSEGVTESISEAAGVFDLESREVKFAKNIHERLYPASTTKILTAYVALKYGDLSAIATVTEEELQLESGSTTCGLSAGDTISLEELLYGLMLCSGNDAANVIADMVSGSVEEFANLMNQEALAMGATNSHFVNANGLHNDEHYTSVYDMYLIFQTAIQDERFVQLISTQEHTANFQNSAGEAVVKDWKNTNRYLNGKEETPEGISVIGGKTGTTNAAGSCLVLYSKKGDSIPYISIIFKADNGDNLYKEMSELLTEITK